MIKLNHCVMYVITINYIHCFVSGYCIKFLTQHEEPVFEEEAIDLIKFCFIEYEYILIYDKSKGNIAKYLWMQEPIISILMNFQYNSYYETEDEKKRKRGLIKKVDAFIFVVNSPNDYYITLKGLKGCFFWNIMIPIFIIITSSEGCNAADTLFEITWNAGYLTSYFFCNDSKNNSFIYTYNPYTNRAPTTWKLAKGRLGKIRQWTLYKRPYNKDNLCNGLVFDRTKFLDGTTAKMRDLQTVNWEEHGEATYIKLFKDSIMSSLNITALDNNIKFHHQKNNTYLFEENYIISDPIDIYFLITNRYYQGVIRSSYPIKYSELYILSHQRGYFSAIEKIYQFYGSLGIIATVIILMMVFIVTLLIRKKNRIAFAIFEILRLLVNTTLHTKMPSLSLKIFFMMIFLYFLIIQSTFQGNLAKFLTKPAMKKNVDSLEDFATIHRGHSLISRGYDIHDNNMFNVVLCFHECINHLLNNTNLAIVEDYTFAVQHARQYNLYLSKKPILFMSPWYLHLRSNWPLAQRIDKVLMWLEHSGLAKKWSDEWIPDIASYQRMKMKQLEVAYSPIGLGTLMFAFYFLGLGLTCAFLCFIIEKIIGSREKIYEI